MNFWIPIEKAFVTKLEKEKKQENSLIINKQSIKVNEKVNQTDTTDIWQRQVIEKIRTDVDSDFFFSPTFHFFFLHFHFVFVFCTKLKYSQNE